MQRAFFRVSIFFFFWNFCVDAGQPVGPPENTFELVQRLLDANLAWQERDRAVRGINCQYLEVCTMVQTALNNETESNALVKYSSPLHCALRLAGLLHMSDEEGPVLRLVARRLDISSMPAGLEVSGNYFFPAANALVELRIRADKVIDAISSHDDRDTSILCWVLVMCQGKEMAMAMLKHKITVEGAKKARLEKALALIQAAKSENDLLPSLIQKK